MALLFATLGTDPTLGRAENMIHTSPLEVGRNHRAIDPHAAHNTSPTR
jgi:hypothetical protein